MEKSLDSFSTMARTLITENPSLVEGLIGTLYSLVEEMETIIRGKTNTPSIHMLQKEVFAIVMTKLGYTPSTIRKASVEEILKEVRSLSKPTLSLSRRILPS